MPSYRDTLHLLPLNCFVPSITYAEMMEQVDDEICAVGFIHGHKSEDSVEFQVDADDLWELRERMDDLKLSVLPFAELDIRRECVQVGTCKHPYPDTCCCHDAQD